MSYSAARPGRPVHGFTLVELIAVLIVLGILAIGTVRFIGDSSEGFAATVGRTTLASEGRLALERISRELRDALPNSVRSSHSCLEFVPTEAATTYLTLPLATATASLLTVPFDPMPPDGLRPAIYPVPELYALSSPGSVGPAATLSGPDGSNHMVLTLAASHRFSAESPTKRLFLVRDPVSFCLDEGNLYRYEAYGFLPAQPGPESLPGALPERSLLAREVAAAVPFRLNEATLARTAVVSLDLTFSRGGDSVRLQHSVQVRNVP